MEIIRNRKTGIQSYPKVDINFFPEVPVLRKIEDKTLVNIRYTLIAPFTFAHIYWNDKISELVYEIEEPPLTAKEEKYKDELINAMENMINFDTVLEKDMKVILDYIDRMFRILAIELDFDISYDSYKKIYYYLARNFVGFNETEPLLRDYFVEDIESIFPPMVTGNEEPSRGSAPAPTSNPSEALSPSVSQWAGLVPIEYSLEFASPSLSGSPAPS